MECTFYMILTVALFAYAAYGQCPKINERSSDSFPDMLDIVVTGSKSSNFQKKSDILQGIKPDGSIKHSPGIFLTSNDKITIKSTFADNVLMTVKEFRVELFKANETTLQMFSGAQTKYDETEPVNKQIFDKIDFDLKKGILGVDRLVLTFIAPEGEVKVRNIFMKVCIETGWCNWQKWGACSKSCGGGTQGRARTCDCPNPDPMVFECPTDGPTSQNQECNPECCPQPPTWGNWAVWAACSVTCGGGSRSRSRKCIDDKCPDTTLDCQGKKTDKEDCNDECCPKPPKWGAWSKWGDCSVTCAEGTQERFRKCIDDPCPDNSSCPGAKTQTQVCKQPCCPQPPKWGAWSKWGDCSVTCAEGTQERSRKCIDDPCPDNSSCPGAKTQTQVCKQPCCPQPPTWTNWGEWGDCSVTCGGGTMKRRRQCNEDECHDDSDCDGKDTESSKCNEDCCPVPFQWAKWSKWSPCSVTCGDGSMSRSRKCRKSKCPGDDTDCDGPKKQTDTCSLPCCEKIFNAPNKAGVQVYKKNGDTEKVMRVLQGSGGKPVFLLRNDDEREYLELVMEKEYTVLMIKLKTRLSNSVKVSSEPTAWPGDSNASKISDKKAMKFQWNKHHFNMRSVNGVGPIKKIKFDFGFPSGEIQVQSLLLIVCPEDTDSRTIPFKWTKWNKWSPCSVTCGDGSMSRSRRCRKSKCPGDYTGCEGPKKETDTCSLPCCEKIIDFKHKKGVKIFVRDEESTKYLRVLRGHKKSLFLVNNSLVTEYIQVKLGQDYTVLELGVTTRLSSYVKVTSEPEEWPKEDNMSRVPPHKIHAKRWNKHKFDMRPGVGPINYIKLTFGFPYGEINVKDLFLIVCPV